MCTNPITVIIDKEEKTFSCGKCILCRKKKAREWAIKLIKEAEYHKKMCMVTLTFRPKFLNSGLYKELTKTKIKKDPRTGEKKTIKIKYPTVVNPTYINDVKKTKWLVTLFIKKLRKEMSKKNINFSYYAVGEHGSNNTHRAHWHILFYGIDENTLNAVEIGKSKRNKKILFSNLIDEKWSYEGKKCGQHTISEVTEQTIKYVANYTLKKIRQNTQKNYPFTMQFSNQAKIGYKWIRKYHKDLRKGYIEDQQRCKYYITKNIKKELLRFEHQEENESMNQTVIAIEEYQHKLIERMKEKGLLKKEEIEKRAKKAEERLKLQDRDYEIA